MTTSVSYDRGFGGYTFSAGELAELEALKNQLATVIDASKGGNPFLVGAGVNAYRRLLEIISDQIVVTNLDGSQTTTLIPKAGVNGAVWSWINGAVNVNSGQGFYAAFIREYTTAQVNLRGIPLPTTPANANQQASNNIALFLLTDIVDKHTLPGIEGLGAIDAGAAASNVFNHDGLKEYAPWAGTLLFPYLGDAKFYRDLLLNDQQVIATIPNIDQPGTHTELVKYATGTYDLIASLEATEKAAVAAGVSNPYDAIANLFGNVSAPYPNQAALAAETTQWFNSYYKLPAGTFDVGADAVFSQNALDKYDYFVGTYGDDNLVATGSTFDTLDASIMNGGLGNDTITGSKYNDLLDGDQGNDTLVGGKGDDILYGGSGNDTYTYNTGDGWDVLPVADADGQITINGVAASGTHEASGMGFWVNDQWSWTEGGQTFNGLLMYYRDGSTVVDRSTGRITNGYLLVTERSLGAGNTGGITLKRYSTGDLGLNLYARHQSTPSPTPASAVIPAIRAIVDDAEKTVSPLVLDLDGDGVETLHVSNGIHFDHDGNGFAEATGWVDKDDGLLVRDLNSNGKIDTGHELFGNNTLLADGSYAANGFAALADLDANHDGKVDVSDTAFSQLRLWKDTNSNGVTEAGELLTLSAAGVQSISTSYSSIPSIDLNGNQHQQQGSYTTTSNVTRKMDDVWFVAQHADTVNTNTVPVSAEIEALPEVYGFGNVPSLHQAMALDTSGHLKSLVAAFATETSTTNRAALVQQILFAWTGVESIAPNSRGKYVPDARTVYVVDAFMGETFVQGYGTNAGTTSPGPNAAAKLQTAYNQIAGYVSGQLMAQSHLASVYNAISWQLNANGDGVELNVGSAVALLQAAYDTNVVDGRDLLKFLNDGLKLNTDLGGPAVLAALRAAGDLSGSGFALELAIIGMASLIDGTAADESLVGGAQGEFIAGHGGKDTLVGGGGDDFLDGGTGNDVLSGGDGSDMYVFDRGYGQDVINNFDVSAGRQDILNMGKGITPDDLVITRAANDLVIAIANTTDQVTVSNHFVNDTGGGYALDGIRFSNGVTWSAQYINDVYFPLVGGSGNDTLMAFSTGGTVHGNGGDDVITGGAGNDHLYGDEGNDTVNAGAGDDVLSGGTGNDHLQGGAGQDTYQYNVGDGQDIIDVETYRGIVASPLPQDVVQFGAGIKAQDLVLSANGSGDLIIQFRNADGSLNATDGLTIKGYFISPSHYSGYDAQGNYTTVAPSTLERTIKEFRFQDAVYSGPQLEALLLPNNTSGANYFEGTNANDIIAMVGGADVVFGYDGNDQITVSTDNGNYVFGGAGNDTITGYGKLYGNDGNDVLHGGSMMIGGAGSDTYLFNLGDPGFTIGGELDTAPASIDTLQLGIGIRTQDVIVRGWYNDLSISILNPTTGLETAQIVVKNGLLPGAGDAVLDQVRFANGTVWARADIVNQATILSGDVKRNYLTGTKLDDVLSGDAGDDVLRGREGNDTFTGGAGNDLLEDQTGNDTYRFGANDGADELWDSSGTNQIVLDAGITPDRVRLIRSSSAGVLSSGSATADNLVIVIDNSVNQINVENFFVNGTRPISQILFGDGTVWDAAAITAQVVDQHGTANTMTGTTADDTHVVDHRSDVIKEAASAGTDTVLSSVSYTLPTNVENLTLTGSLNIGGTGNALVNVITGNVADNALNSFSSSSDSNADTLIGGLGDDTYFVDWGSFSGAVKNFTDTVIEQANEGYDTIYAELVYSAVLPDNVEALIVRGDRVYISSPSLDSTRDLRRKFVGNVLDNFIDASVTVNGYAVGLTSSTGFNESENVLDGGLGADIMFGSDGANRFVVDNVNDVVIASTRGYEDTVESSISYTLGLGQDNLDLTGSAETSGTGNALSNVLDGSHNLASNVLAGGLGDDTYIVGTGDVLVEQAGEGIDTVLSSSVFYTLAANFENLTLTGKTYGQSGYGNEADNIIRGTDAPGFIASYGNNVLYGYGGNDTLYGEGQADTLFGGDGNDTLYGDSTSSRTADGNDILNGGNGNDVMAGYGGDDTYSGLSATSGLDVIGDSAGIADKLQYDNVRVDDLQFSRLGNDLKIAVDANNAVTVSSWYASTNNVIEQMEVNENGLLYAYTSAQIQGRADGINTGPVVNAALAGQSTMATQAFSYQVALNTFADIESQHSLNYSATLSDGSALPSWLVFDAATRTFSGTPPGASVGTLSVNVTATDAGGLSASTGLSIAVTPAIIYGTAGDDVLVGDATNNTMYGYGGNDLLDGGAGADTMTGGTGNDTYVVDNTGDVITENVGEGTDTVQSSITYTLDSNVENLTLTGTAAINGTGNTLDNILIGNSANNTLTGNAGNDTLDGGAGADTMAGGAGNDTYIVDDNGDVVTEASSAGTDLVQSYITYTLGSNVENLTLMGTSVINGTGNTLANVITGNSADNVLNGGTGADTLKGGLGNDTYVVDNTGDVVTENASEGTDLVQSSVAYTLGANLENLTLTGTSAINGTGNTLDNILIGNSANNTLTGGAGNDTLDGKAGTDTMVGGAGDDVYYADIAADVTTEAANEGIDTVNSAATRTLAANIEALFLTGTSAINGTGNTLANLLRGNTANNTLAGGGGTDILEGGAGNDILSNASGNTLLNGGAGTDTLTGTANNDLLIGGAGNDAITTGQGADIIAFNKGDGQDTVAASTTKDNTLSIGGGVTYADLLFQKSGSNLILKIGASDQITFTGYYTNSGNRSVDKLQVVLEGSADYNASSTNAMYNKKIETFNFDGLVAAFDAALVANPSLTSWALSGALVAQYLSGSDAAAMGGDLAYQYGRYGNEANVSYAPAIGILGSSSFGTGTQALQPLGSLQDSSPRLS